MEKINKSLEEWQKILPHDVFAITRGAGTEPPFDNLYHSLKEKGIYRCSNCNLSHFSSEDKFDSGTGWPSFTKPIDESHINTQTDSSQRMTRVEAICARCGSHLGHVFDDGPAPTGMRFCMNSAALNFQPLENLKEFCD